ncbi:hypothetical protein ACGFYV_27205 [Streptomyces sp. NPDC048297]
MTAEDLREQLADGEVRNAVLAVLDGVDAPTAARLLEESGGQLRAGVRPA